MIMRVLGSAATMSPRIEISSSFPRSAACDTVADIDRATTIVAAKPATERCKEANIAIFLSKMGYAGRNMRIAPDATLIDTGKRQRIVAVDLHRLAARSPASLRTESLMSRPVTTR